MRIEARGDLSTQRTSQHRCDKSISSVPFHPTLDCHEILSLTPYTQKNWEGTTSKKIITNAAQGPNSDRGAKPSHPRCWGASQRLDAKLSAPFARQVKQWSSEAMGSAKLGMSTFDIFERYNRMNVRDSGNPWIELASTILQHVWGTWFNQLLTLRSCNQKEWTVAK